MKQAFAVALIVCTQAVFFAPLLAQQPAVGITISAMDRRSVMVFDRLVITGTGFQPSTAAISVLFVPKQHGAPVVIPVYSATATSVEVIVPPFLDPANGEFGFGQVDVQVVQVTRDQVASSSVLTGLDVAPLPAVPGSIGPGRITRAFLRQAVEFIAVADSATSPAARAAFAAFKQEQAALLALVERVVANPESIAVAASLGSAPFVIDAAMLKASDRLIAAYLASIVPTLNAQRSLGRLALTPLATGDCEPDVDRGRIDQLFCDYRSSVTGENRKLVTGAAIIAGIGGAGAALFGGPVLIGAGFAVAGVAVLGSQIFYMGVSATLVPAFMEAEPPPTMRSAFTGLFDYVAAKGRWAIAKATGRAADAADEVEKLERRTPGSSPQGGSLVAAPGLAAADPVREMLYVPMGKDPVITAFGVPSTPSIQTFTQARLPPTTLASFDGSYSGQLSVPSSEFVQGGDYGLVFTVAGGQGKVTEYVAGGGSVGAGGRVEFETVSPGGFRCGMTGALELRSATGDVSGGGGIDCSNGQYRLAGVWSASRKR